MCDMAFIETMHHNKSTYLFTNEFTLQRVHLFFFFSHQRRPPVFTRAVVDFNFGAAPIGSEPCVVQLMLENSGAVSTEW